MFVLNKLVLVYDFGFKPNKCMVWCKRGHQADENNQNSL